MVHDFRGKFAKPVWEHLKELQNLWGYRYPGQTLEHLIVEAHQKYLAPSSWDSDVHRAVAVLRRLKPTMLLTPADIVEVRVSATAVKIQVRLEADLFVVSRKEWDA
jgi:hypothetical protein